jgi:hypothetical protein
VEIAVGQDEAQVAQADGHRGDGGVRIAEPRQHQHGDAGHHEAEHQPANELAQEGGDRPRRIGREAHRGRARRRLADQDSREQAKGRDGHGIVQKRFALRQNRQALGCTDVAENSDNGRRIGRRHHRPQQQADDDVHAGCQAHHAGHAGDADQHGDDGEQQDRRDLVEQAADVDRQTSGEKQWRQKQGQEHIRPDLELVEPDEGIAQRPQLDVGGNQPGA